MTTSMAAPALTGGLGNDTFVFTATSGNDTVTDFENGEDLIDVSAFGFASAADVIGLLVQDGADVDMVLSATSTITFTGETLASFDASDFII